jgi:hypothetical protein
MRFRKTDSLGVRLCRIAPMLSVALFVGSAIAAPPPGTGQPSDGPPAMDAHDGAAVPDDSKVAPLPWSQLNPTQRAMLAPLQSQWDQLPPHRQQRMAAHAEQWMQLPPERRAQIQQRMARWAQMTPEQRRDAAHGEEAFRAMPEADRQRVVDAYQRFQSLTPEQRRMLMHRFHEERRARQGMDGQGQPPPQR